MAVSLAEPASLFGQLQRGRGAGFLAALHADPGAVAPLLLNCILDDPRFDSQLENRADYYAQLALHVNLPLAPLEDALRTHADENVHYYPRLPIPVLARMAWRGSGEAAAILVRYLSYGPEWAEAFEAIVGGGHETHSVAELGNIILQRFPDDAMLTMGLEKSALDKATWERWAAAEPRIAPLIAAARRPIARPSEQSIRATIDPAWDVPTLLSHITEDSAGIIGEMVGLRASVRDLPALLDSFWSNDTLQLRVAARALAILRLQEALPPLLRFVEEFDANDDARFAYYRLNRIRRILAVTPAALPTARAWLGCGGWARPSVALSILEEQSEQDDVPVLRALLAAAIDHEAGEVTTAYSVEGCLTALKPFPTQVSYEELARVFEQTWSMWNRREAAELMADGHLTTFSRAYAIECLWDCEDDLVKIGCVHADLSPPLVRERLDHLLHSPHEHDDVRREAEMRLQLAAI